MAECRYFPECQRCNETGDSWLPCAGGSDGTRCHGYEPMPDVDALMALADEIYDTSCDNHGELSVSLGDIWGWAQAIREAMGVTDNADA